MSDSRLPLLVILALGASSFTVHAGDTLQVAGARARAPRGPAFMAGELIVQFRSGADEAVAERTLRQVGAVRARKSSYSERYLVNLPEGETTEAALSRLRSMPEVDYAEPNAVLHAHQSSTFHPNDRFFRAQWNFQLVGAERTWAIQRGSPQVAVAVLDTGIAYEDFGPFHRAPDWNGTSFLPGFDFVNNDDHPNDDEGHGTHVSSTIAEATNNSEGVAGLAFGCALMPVKVLNNEGSGATFTIAEGIDFAVRFTRNGQNPVKVINLSLGGEFSSETITRAIDRAVAAGVVVVASSGNDGEDNGAVSFPARLPNVIAVGAVDLMKRRAPYSSFGPEVDVVAPGGDSTRDDDHDGNADAVFQQTLDPRLPGRFDTFCYCGFEGTSMAAPHVAALAALLVSQGITSPAAVKASIESTAEDLGTPGRDDQFGMGLIRPSVALSGLGINQ